MEKKDNDLMLNIVANPEYSLQDFATIGLTIDNTSLQDKDVYRNNPLIQKSFTDKEGKFNETAFNKAYNSAVYSYNQLASNQYNQDSQNQVIYHRDNIFAPKEKRRQGPDFKQVAVANPDQVTSSMIRLGQRGERVKSQDELAQTSQVLLNPSEVYANGDADWSKAEWGTDPNHGFFNYFTDTLVMAQWDEDGIHTDPITGQTQEHKKGDLKIGQDGTYFYEKLDGRDIYGRRVLNKMNTLTEDGSNWNKYDFFDSDDINQKSVGGTLMKNLALVGTMFIPYVGPVIAGASVTTQLAGLVGTLGKMFTGSENDFFSELEGFSKSWNRQTGKTEYAQNNTWCWENFIGLIGDVAGQLKEQRFIFDKIPYLIKGPGALSKKQQVAKLAKIQEDFSKSAASKISEIAAKYGKQDPRTLKAAMELNTVATLKAQSQMDSWIKGYNKIGEILSKGYMTAITVGDTYGEAKAAGASDWEATLLTLGYAAGEYAIINSQLGKWILPELRVGKYKNKAIIKALTDLDKPAKDLYQKFGNELKNMPEKGKKEWAQKLFNIGKGIAKSEYANGTRTLSATLASGAGEGFEEVSEEFLADFSKGCFNTINWLRGNDTRMDSFGFSWNDNGQVKWDGSELVNRYSMSLAGGAVGGAITNVGTNYRMSKNYANMTSEQAMREVVYMARNGSLDELYKTIDKEILGNKYLSMETQEIAGKEKFKPGTATENQDQFVKSGLKQQLKMIENLLAAEGVKISDESFLDIQTLKDLRYNALYSASTAGLFMEHFNSLVKDMAVLTDEINKIVEKVDTNKDGVVSDREAIRAKLSTEDQQRLKEKEDKLKEIKQKLTDYKEGKYADDFIGTTLFEMSPTLSQYFIPSTFPLFAEKYIGKKWADLTEADKDRARTVYEQWKNTTGKDQIYHASKIYREMANQVSSVVKQHEQTYLNQSQKIIDFQNQIADIYNGLQRFSDDPDNWLVHAQTLLQQLSQTQAVGMQKEIDSLRQEIDEASNIEDPAIIAPRVQHIRQTLLNLISFSITTEIQDFVNQGFATVESKNTLTQILEGLYSAVANEKNNFDAVSAQTQGVMVDDLLVDPTYQNPFNEVSAHIIQLIDNVEKLNTTPLEQNINQFAISLGENPINITELLEKLNSVLNYHQSIEDFNIDDVTYQELENAIQTLYMYKAAITGAKTDNIGLGNVWGYNAILNEVSKKLGKTLDLAEIDKTIADIFNSDIDTNLRKLEFLRNLYSVNQGQKLSRQSRVSVKKDLLIHKALKAIIHIQDPNKNQIQTWLGYQEFANIIEGLDILNEVAQGTSLSLDPDKKAAFEEARIQMEDAVYDFLTKNLDKIQDPAQLSKLISLFDIYTQSNVLLNESLTDLDGPSLIWWLAARAAMKPSDFYTSYKDLLTPQSLLAPIATQELAIFNNVASVINGDVIANFVAGYRYYIKENWKSLNPNDRKRILLNLGNSQQAADKFSQDAYNDYCFNFLPVPRYSNVSFTEGIPGSGKTASVIYQTLQFLNRYYPDLLKDVRFVHGANPDSATKLQKDCGMEGKGKAQGHDQFLSEIIVNYTPTVFDKDGKANISPSNYTLNNSDNEIVSNASVSATNPPSLIIIDEITKFTTFELDAINTYAKKHGITVLVAGDFDQSGVVGECDVNMAGETFSGYNVSLERNMFYHTPKLGVVIRTDNNLKANNLVKLQTWINTSNPQSITLEYYDDGQDIIGDRIFEGQLTDEVKQAISRMINNLDKDNHEQIGFVCSDINSPLAQYLTKTPGIKEHIKLLQNGTAQGLEGRYYIIDFSNSPTPNFQNPDNQSKTFLKDLYTGISRSSKASITLVPVGSRIESRPAQQVVKDNFGQAAITKYTTDKLAIWNQILHGGTPQFQARTKVEPTAQQSQSQGGLSNPLNPPTNPPTNLPTAPPLNPPAITTQVTLTKDELRQKYGPIIDLDQFEITVNGRKAIIKFVPVSVVTKEGNNEVTQELPVVALENDTSIVYYCAVRLGNHTIHFVYDYKGHSWIPSLSLVYANDQPEVLREIISYLNQNISIDQIPTFTPDQLADTLFVGVLESTLQNLDNYNSLTNEEFDTISNSEEKLLIDEWQRISELLPSAELLDKNGNKITGNEVVEYNGKVYLVLQEVNGKLHIQKYNGDVTLSVDPSEVTIIELKDKNGETLQLGDEVVDYKGVIYVIKSARLDGTLDVVPENSNINTIVHISEVKKYNQPKFPFNVGDSIDIAYSQEDYNADIQSGNIPIAEAGQFINTGIVKSIDNNQVVIELDNGTQLTYPISEIVNSWNTLFRISQGKIEYQPLPSEPLIQTVVNTEKHKKTIDDTNKRQATKPQLQAGTKEEPIIGLDLFFHSFNTFELGAVVDSHDNVVFDGFWSVVRRDSVNGLRRLDAIKAGVDPLHFNPHYTKDEVLERLAILRSFLLNATDINQLKQDLSDYLGIPGVYVNFALKTTPTIADQTKKDSNKNYVGNKPFAHLKHKLEQIFYNGSKDTRSKEIIPHQIVALIGNDINGDIIEIPLLTLTSPLTIAQLTYKDSQGNIIPRFPELFNIVAKYKATFINGKPSPQTPQLHKVIQELADECAKQQKYFNIEQLIKLYQFNFGGLFRIDDPNWLPSTNLENCGSQFEQEKGELQVVDGFTYSGNWQNISEYAEDPQVAVTPIMKSLTGTITLSDGTGVKVCHPGHPFVLVSHDKNITNSTDIIKEYYAQTEKLLRGEKVVKKIDLIYILPPAATVQDYLQFIRTPWGTRKNLDRIGNSYTPYTLLKLLRNDPEFMQLLQQRISPEVFAFAINALDKCIDAENRAETLAAQQGTEPDKSELNTLLQTSVNYGTRKDKSIIQMSLLNYFEKILIGASNLAVNPIRSRIPQIDPKVVDIIERVLKANNLEILYDVELTRQTYGPNNEFNVVRQRNGWLVAGKPCMINGKIDSYMFYGEGVENLINLFLSKIKPLYNREGSPVIGEGGVHVLGSKDSYKEKPNRFKPTSFYRKYKNIADRFGITVPDMSLEEQSNFNKADMNQRLDKIVQQLNVKGGLFAIRVDDKIITSKDNTNNVFFTQLNQIKIFNLQGNEIFDVVQGQNFIIRGIDQNGEIVEYNAEFGSDDVLTISQDITITPETVLNINPVTQPLYSTLFENFVKLSEHSKLRDVANKMAETGDVLVALNIIKRLNGENAKAAFEPIKNLIKQSDLSDAEKMQLMQLIDNIIEYKQNRIRTCPQKFDIKLK